MGWVRTLAMCVAALAALTVSSSAQNAGQGDGRRVALVIGNGAYGDMGVLTNPVRDAKAVSVALKNAGFNTVVEAEDLDVEKFQRSLREFRRVADGSSIALIYFAGHGMEVYGQNWLIPLSANITTPNDLPLEAIALEQLLRSLSGASTKVLILDACRNNPFARSIRLPGGAVRSSTTGGLAPVNEAAVDGDDNGGLLVMYAAAPGTTADDGLPSDANSPFARALVSKLPTRGVDIRRMAGGVRDLTLTYTGRRQRPFTTDSLGEADVYLAAGAGEAPPATTGAPSPSNADAPRLLARARAAGARGDCQAIKDFISLFPNDPIVASAQAELKRCVDTYLDRLVAVDTSELSDATYQRFATQYGIELAALRAITKVESTPTGGYTAEGRPIILFEPHLFSRRTERRFDTTNPNISYRAWGGRPYPRDQAGRWAQLREAYALDPEAAVASTSWGAYQILGLNYARSGFTSATEFVAALSRSRTEQLQAFLSFIQASELMDEVQRLDWEGFARGYNGPGQTERYGRLLREAYTAAGGDASRLPAASTAPTPVPTTPNGVTLPNLGEPAPPTLGWSFFAPLALLAAGAAFRRRRA